MLEFIQTKVIGKGYNLAHQTENTMFENISKHPERAQRYAEAMKWSSSGPGFETSHILDCYPWDAVGTIVDVGGGYGSFSMALAERFPTIRCIVQDKAEVVERAQTELPSALKSQVSFMVHDFFQAQPVIGADVYFLRWILHDWSDAYAARILQGLIPALKEGSKIVINEAIVPEPGVASSYREKMVR